MGDRGVLARGDGSCGAVCVTDTGSAEAGGGQASLGGGLGLVGEVALETCAA